MWSKFTKEWKLNKIQKCLWNNRLSLYPECISFMTPYSSEIEQQMQRLYSSLSDTKLRPKL